MPIMPKTSQREQVLAYLKAGNSITPAKALYMFKCQRLADVIWKLKKAGHKIHTRLQHDPVGCRYAEYTLATN